MVVVKGEVWRLRPAGVAWDRRILCVFDGGGCTASLAWRLAQCIGSVDFKGGGVLRVIGFEYNGVRGSVVFQWLGWHGIGTIGVCLAAEVHGGDL